MDKTTFEKLVNLVRRYDRFTCYIDNYKQEQEAERCNDKIEAEFIEILASLGVENEEAHRKFRVAIASTGTVSSPMTAEQAVEEMLNTITKEDDSMKKANENTNATVNNATTKEETTMKKTNVHAADYVTKDAIRKELEALGITLTKNQFKSTKRDELLAMLNKAKADATSVPVGDLEITRDNADAPAEAKKVLSAKEKTVLLLQYIKEIATTNQKNGFGYSISGYMLQAMILKADTGLEKMKGHVVTDEEHATCMKIYKWLKDKGYIKAAVYSVVEDDKVRVYIPGVYNGNLDTKHVRMVPYNQSGNYTAKQITSYTVLL